MEQYIVSARKYRPMTFGSVVGQEALTTTLKNAIATGKLAHAYLFCGPRGVGKTTCARIFAKTINCFSPTPAGDACGMCESCRAFNEGRSFTIHELDAASNNSVNDIRSLIEQVQIPPQVGRYKVFILDEVHMLSKDAANAFLKTLEEPPAHAIFILATTEKHKILPTILSRCQIFDFNRMEVTSIVDHLKHVADSEGYDYEEEALGVIARKADGGMRDALSLFDQAAGFSEGHITYEKVIQNLNVLDYDYYFNTVDLCLKADVGGVLLQFNDILSKGFDGMLFVAGLASHLRDLLVSRAPETVTLLDVAASARQRYAQQAARCPRKFLFRALKICNDCTLAYRQANNKRLLVELTLIEVARLAEPDESPAGRSPKEKQNPEPSAQQTPASAVVSKEKPQQKELEPAAASPLAPSRTAPPAPTERKAAPLPLRQVISIHRSLDEVQQTARAKQQVSAPAREEVPATPTEPSEPDRKFSEADATLQWSSYASLLPREQTALAERLRNIRLRLANDGYTLEVPIDSERVKQLVEPLLPNIEAFLQKGLHNSAVRLTIAFTATSEPARTYSRAEILEQMRHNNPAVGRLIEEFDLRL